MSHSARNQEFMELLTLHQGQICGYLYALTQNLEDTEDVFQQTSLILWNKFDDYQRGTSFASWAIATARFEALNFLRARRRAGQQFSDQVLNELVATPIDVDTDPTFARQRALTSCLERLPEKDRGLVQLRYAERHTVRAIAAQSGRSEQGVSASLKRIRRALYDCVHRTLSRGVGS